MNQSRSLDWVIAVCSAALLAPLLWPVVAGRVFVYDDLLWFHLPLRYLYQQALSGESDGVSYRDTWKLRRRASLSR